jgi:acetyltransferase-like isoleucine patch superfamily enzyme
MAVSVSILERVVFFGQGSLDIAANVVLGWPLGSAPGLPIMLQPRDSGARIDIGPGSILANGCELIARTSIKIGANCRIGARVSVFDSDFHGVSPDTRDTPGASAAVVVGDNVWIGNDVVLLKGVSVGPDAVIGTGTVITRGVPAGAIVVGAASRLVGSVYARRAEP